MHFSPYLFGFVPFAEKELSQGGYSDAEALERIKKNIRDDGAWYQSIVQQAEERGITVEENLQKNAEYVLYNYKQNKQTMSE